MAQTLLVFVPVILLFGAALLIPRPRRRSRRMKVRPGY
jgi:hypothetical protein